MINLTKFINDNLKITSPDLQIKANWVLFEGSEEEMKSLYPIGNNICPGRPIAIKKAYRLKDNLYIMPIAMAPIEIGVIREIWEKDICPSFE